MRIKPGVTEKRPEYSHLNDPVLELLSRLNPTLEIPAELLGKDLGISIRAVSRLVHAAGRRGYEVKVIRSVCSVYNDGAYAERTCVRMDPGAWRKIEHDCEEYICKEDERKCDG